jgi:Tfp pilus assembly protein PilF
MTIVKRTLLFMLAAGLLLAIGCNSQTMSKNRDNARERWAASRAKIATQLAQACFNRGEYAKAEEHLTDLIRADEPYAPMFVLATRLATERGDLDLARAYATNAVTIDPDMAEAHYVLGTVEQTLNHLQAAADEYDQAAMLEPDTARYILAQAEMLVWQQKSDEAVDLLRDASSRMPGRSDIFAALGDVLSMMARYDEAAGCFRVALRLDPNQTYLKERLATALFYSGAYAEAESALADLSPAAGRDDQPVWINHMRAESLMAVGRIDEARKMYVALADIQPSAAAPLIGLAKCDLLENHTPQARQWLEKALSRNARDSEANALMGYVLLTEGRTGEAVAYLEQALSDPKLPDRASVERLLGQVRESTRAAAPEKTADRS